MQAGTPQGPRFSLCHISTSLLHFRKRLLSLHLERSLKPLKPLESLKPLRPLNIITNP